VAVDVNKMFNHDSESSLIFGHLLIFIFFLNVWLRRRPNKTPSLDIGIKKPGPKDQVFNIKIKIQPLKG